MVVRVHHKVLLIEWEGVAAAKVDVIIVVFS